MSALSPERAYRERVRTCLRRALELVEDLKIEDDDAAGLSLLQLTSAIEQDVYDATYSEVARLRDEATRRAQHEAAIASAKLGDVLRRIRASADRLAGMLAMRGPAPVVRIQVEPMLAAVLRLLVRCDRHVWRDTYSAPDGSETPYGSYTSAGEEPHVQEMLAWLTERLAPIEVTP